MSQSLLLSSAILPVAPDPLAAAGRADPAGSSPADAASFSNVLTGQIKDLNKNPQHTEKNEITVSDLPIAGASLPPSSDADIVVSTTSVPAPDPAEIVRDDLSLRAESGLNAVLPLTLQGGNTLPADRQAMAAFAQAGAGQSPDTITLPAIPWGLVATDPGSEALSRNTGAGTPLPSETVSSLLSPTPAAGEEMVAAVASGSGSLVEISPEDSLPAGVVPRRPDPRSPPDTAQAVALPGVMDAEMMGIPGRLPDEPAGGPLPVANPRRAEESSVDATLSGISASTGVAEIAAARMSSGLSSTSAPAVGGAEPGALVQQPSAAGPVRSDPVPMAGVPMFRGSPGSAEFRLSPASTEVTAALVAGTSPMDTRDPDMLYAAEGAKKVLADSQPAAAAVPGTAPLQTMTVSGAGSAATPTAQIAAIPPGQDAGASTVPAGLRSDGRPSSTMERLPAGVSEGQGTWPGAGLRAVDVSGMPRPMPSLAPDPDPTPAVAVTSGPSLRPSPDIAPDLGNLPPAGDRKTGVATSVPGLFVGREAWSEDTYNLRPALTANGGVPLPQAAGVYRNPDPGFQPAIDDAPAALVSALPFATEETTGPRQAAAAVARPEPVASTPVAAVPAPAVGVPSSDGGVPPHVLGDSSIAPEDALLSIGAAAGRTHAADTALGAAPSASPLARGPDITAPAPALPQAPGSLPILLGAATGRLGEELGHRILWLSGHNLRSAEIQLDPPELGPLQVQVHSHRDGASIQFTAHSAAARDAVESNLPRLRELLEGSGLNLLDVNVAQQQQRGARGEREAFESGNPASRGRLAAIGQAGEVSAPARRSLGLVDDYA